jgi:serine/threonine protein kinase
LRSSEVDIKLADFELAVKKLGGELRLKCGTPGYIAPEIPIGELYTEKVDIYSYGVILYFM